MDLIKRPKQVAKSQKGYLTNEQYQDYAEQQFNSIYNYLDTLMGIFNFIGDKIQRAEGTATGTSSTREFKTIGNMTLTKGKYLVLGACVSNISSQSLEVQVNFSFPNGTTTFRRIGGNTVYRGTMISGGGTAGWIVLDVYSDTVIELKSYVNNTYTITGFMCSIPILN